VLGLSLFSLCVQGLTMFDLCSLSVQGPTLLGLLSLCVQQLISLHED